ncbi:unnamed protein product, partial [Closterium sp. Yama58-4]
ARRMPPKTQTKSPWNLDSYMRCISHPSPCLSVNTTEKTHCCSSVRHSTPWQVASLTVCVLHHDVASHLVNAYGKSGAGRNWARPMRYVKMMTREVTAGKTEVATSQTLMTRLCKLWQAKGLRDE